MRFAEKSASHHGTGILACKFRRRLAASARKHEPWASAHAFKCGADILVCGLRRLSSRQLFWYTGLENPVNPQVGKPAPQMRRFRLIESKDLNAWALGFASLTHVPK